MNHLGLSTRCVSYKNNPTNHKQWSIFTGAAFSTNFNIADMAVLAPDRKVGMGSVDAPIHPCCGYISRIKWNNDTPVFEAITQRWPVPLPEMATWVWSHPQSNPSERLMLRMQVRNVVMSILSEITIIHPRTWRQPKPAPPQAIPRHDRNGGVSHTSLEPWFSKNSSDCHVVVPLRILLFT